MPTRLMQRSLYCNRAASLATAFLYRNSDRTFLHVLSLFLYPLPACIKPSVVVCVTMRCLPDVQVRRLQSEKQWLEEQVNPVLQTEGCMPPVGGPPRPPLRHLSI